MQKNTLWMKWFICGCVLARACVSYFCSCKNTLKVAMHVLQTAHKIHLTLAVKVPCIRKNPYSSETGKHPIDVRAYVMVICVENEIKWEILKKQQHSQYFERSKNHVRNTSALASTRIFEQFIYEVLFVDLVETFVFSYNTQFSC